jgi:dolichol-phosphate mannosyltransferase
MDLSVVVPIYREEQNIPVFLERILPVLRGVTEDYEVIFCLDPSPDRSEELVLEHRQKDGRIKLVKFSRRFGQPMATLAGMRYSSGNRVVVMDVDLQDPPELIPQMVAKAREGFDVVYAQRTSREGETLIKRLEAWVAYRLIHRIAEVEIPPDTGDFRLMSRRVVDEVNKLKESHGFLRGLVPVVGFKQASVRFHRPARFGGKGKYNRLIGSISMGLNGIVCFSNRLLSLSSALGFLVAGVAFVLGVAYFCMKLGGFGFPMGNPTIVILILFMGGVQLISVGVLGEYIARIYDEVKERPKFIVDKAVGFEEAGAGRKP